MGFRVNYVLARYSCIYCYISLFREIILQQLDAIQSQGMPSKKGKVSSINICLNIGGEVCVDKGAVAEKFNSFYTTVASKLVEKLPKSVNKFRRQFVQTFYKLLST